MLAAITGQLREALQDRSVPCPVVYGPERMAQSSSVVPHIVIERDRQQGDTLRDAPTHRKNPALIYARGIGTVVRVFAQSTVAGAGIEDHERDADKFINQVLLALRIIVTARKSLWRIKAARFLTAAELEQAGLMTWPGAVYELRCEIDMGVADKGYEAEAAAEATMGGEHGVSVGTTLDTSDSPAPTTDLPGAKTRI